MMMMKCNTTWWIWWQMCWFVDGSRGYHACWVFLLYRYGKGEPCRLRACSGGECYYMEHQLTVCACMCSCGTFERTTRGPCRHLSVTLALCAACTSRAVAWWAARQTTLSRCGTCPLSRAGRVLHAKWRWLDTVTLYDACRSDSVSLIQSWLGHFLLTVQCLHAHCKFLNHFFTTTL